MCSPDKASRFPIFACAFTIFPQHHYAPFPSSIMGTSTQNGSSVSDPPHYSATPRDMNVDELDNNADAQLAAQFGYKPVFKREFGYLSAFSFAVSISGLFATVMTTFYYPLVAGGASAAVWCWLISGAGCMCIAVSLEFCTRISRQRQIYYPYATNIFPMRQKPPKRL